MIGAWLGYDVDSGCGDRGRLGGLSPPLSRAQPFLHYLLVSLTFTDTARTTHPEPQVFVSF